MGKLKPKLLGSSVDPTKLALTIKGIIVAIIPILMILGIDTGDMPALADNIVIAIEAITGAVSAVMVVWGIIRKIYVAVKK